jgi:hypothetical protein
MKTIFDGQIDFNDDKGLNTLLEHLNPQLATKIIELGIEKSQSNGIFNLTESHCLYKCINYLKTLEKTKIEDGQE